MKIKTEFMNYSTATIKEVEDKVKELAKEVFELINKGANDESIKFAKNNMILLINN